MILMFIYMCLKLAIHPAYLISCSLIVKLDGDLFVLSLGEFTHTGGIPRHAHKICGHHMERSCNSYVCLLCGLLI